MGHMTELPHWLIGRACLVVREIEGSDLCLFGVGQCWGQVHMGCIV